MARYNDKANTGYGRLLFDTEGREHAVVGYAKTHNYVAKSEEVFEYRKGFGSIGPYSGHGIRDESILMPWCQSSANDRPFQDDGFFSNFHDHVGHPQNYKGGSQNRDARDSTRQMVYDQRKGLPWNRDASEPNRLGVYDHNKGLPHNRDARDPSRVAVYGQSKGSPRSSNANDQSWLVAHGQSKGSPGSKEAYESSRFMSPPLKDRYDSTHEYGGNNGFSEEEDDDIRENGAYDKQGGSKPINHLKEEDYDKEKHKGNGYALKKNPYYETPFDTNGKHDGNSHVPSSYTVPITIPQRKGPYFDPSTYNNIRPVVNGPKPIKTKPDPDFSNENTRNSPVSAVVQQPQYNGSPIVSPKPIRTRPNPDFPNENTKNSPISVAVRQPQNDISPRTYRGYEQSIHNEASPPADTYARDKYKGNKIDAKEAAKIFNGVFID